MLSVRLAAATSYYVNELTVQNTEADVLSTLYPGCPGLLPLEGLATFYLSQQQHAPAFGFEDKAQFDIAKFARLRSGRTLSGTSLRQRQNGRMNIEAFDFTFSAPKSLSVLWCLGAIEQNSEMILTASQIHFSAVRQALDLYSSTLALCRKGKQGNEGVTTGTIAGTIFNHYDSRPSGVGNSGDPQLHSHCLIFNTVYDGQKFRALDARPIMKKEVILTFGQAYQKAIADGLHDHKIDHVLVQGPEGMVYPEISTVPKPLITAFSSRTNAISRHSIANKVSRQTASLNTRRPKTSNVLEQLNDWKKKFDDYRFGLRRFKLRKLNPKPILKANETKLIRDDFLTQVRGKDLRLSHILRQIILDHMGNPRVSLSEIAGRLNASHLFTQVRGRIAMFRLSNHVTMHSGAMVALEKVINRLSKTRRLSRPKLSQDALLKIQRLLGTTKISPAGMHRNERGQKFEDAMVYQHTDAQPVLKNQQDRNSAEYPEQISEEIQPLGRRI
jgi:conjugative relaxase-like TrwC/TraI family protein